MKTENESGFRELMELLECLSKDELCSLAKALMFASARARKEDIIKRFIDYLRIKETIYKKTGQRIQIGFVRVDRSWNGWKYCAGCRIYVKTLKKFCPVCGRLMRAKSKYKRKSNNDEPG